VDRRDRRAANWQRLRHERLAIITLVVTRKRIRARGAPLSVCSCWWAHKDSNLGPGGASGTGVLRRRAGKALAWVRAVCGVTADPMDEGPDPPAGYAPPFPRDRRPYQLATSGKGSREII
jgi:hypothetical protein